MSPPIQTSPRGSQVYLSRRRTPSAASASAASTVLYAARKSNLTRVDGVNSTRHRRGARAQTRRWRAGELHTTSTPSIRRCAETERHASTGAGREAKTTHKKHRRPGLRERLGLRRGPPAGRRAAGPRDGRHKNRKVVRGSASRRLRVRAHVPARAPAVSYTHLTLPTKA